MVSTVPPLLHVLLSRFPNLGRSTYCFAFLHHHDAREGWNRPSSEDICPRCPRAPSTSPTRLSR